MKLKNKVALITGSSRGIGKAIALYFAKEGAKIIVNYSHAKEEAEKVVDEIKKMGTEVIAIKCDVSDEKQIKEMIENIVKRFGVLDILVNNAGVVFDTHYLDRTIEQWNQTLATNLTGNFLCTKHCAPIMLKKGGVIINISSTNAINAFSPYAMDYDASKAGILILTKDFAKELAPKIRVNAIAPGWVNTEMNKNLPQEFIKKEIEKIYLKRFAQPEEIAKTALFLASDDSNYITGATIIIDGGYG